MDYLSTEKTRMRKAKIYGKLLIIPLPEGNTRTTAVFFIKYIRSLGFHATNDVFAKNAWYFRNALVRANYSDLGAGIHEDLSYLENFLWNLLMGESYELKNRYLHIAWKESACLDEKQPIEQPIEQPIGENSLSEILETKTISSRSKANITRLYDEFGNEKVFGRGDVMEVLGITERPATALIGRMYELALTERITGAGKGKYRIIPAGNEPSGCACTSIWRLPRGLNTPQLCCVTSWMPRQLAAGYLTVQP